MIFRISSVFILMGILYACKSNLVGKEEILAYDMIPIEGTDMSTVIKKDSLGRKLIEGNVLNGKKNGSWITYSPDGQIIDITNYIDNKKEGPYIKFSGNSISEFGSFSNNSYHGRIVKYLYGHLDEAIEFEHGIKKGWAKKFYSNGSVQYEMELIDSIRNGMYRFYGPDGKLQIEEKFKNGVKVSGGIVNQ